MADPLTCGARYLRQPTLVFHALERMEMLEPELMRGVCCDLPSYALVYVEQYRGDVPRLNASESFYARPWCKRGSRTAIPMCCGWLKGYPTWSDASITLPTLIASCSGALRPPVNSETGGDRRVCSTAAAICSSRMVRGERGDGSGGRAWIWLGARLYQNISGRYSIVLCILLIF